MLFLHNCIIKLLVNFKRSNVREIRNTTMRLASYGDLEYAVFPRGSL